MNYILIQFGECLGPMIECESYKEAVEQAAQLAASSGCVFTNEDSLAMYEEGVALPNGDRLSIGQTEAPWEQE